MTLGWRGVAAPERAFFVVHEISQLWLETAQAALSFVSEPRVNERWTSDSCLPEMTIGALSGHLLHSGILLVEETLTADVPDVSTASAATLFSWVPLEEADPVHADVRSILSPWTNRTKASGISLRALRRA
jgi:hypothetical protein